MSFRVLFLAHARDADRTKHRSVIDTGMYHLTVVVVRNQREALEVCDELVTSESIDSILLCPGFTHKAVAEIAKLAGSHVSVAVARGDGPSSKASLAARQRAGYFSKHKEP